MTWGWTSQAYWCEQSLFKYKVSRRWNLPRKGRSLRNEGCWFSSLLLFSSGQTWADITYSDILPPITSKTTSSIILKHETETWTNRLISCGFHQPPADLVMTTFTLLSLANYIFCAFIALLSEMHVTFLVVCWAGEEGELSEEHVIRHFVSKALLTGRIPTFGVAWFLLDRKDVEWCEKQKYLPLRCSEVAQKAHKVTGNLITQKAQMCAQLRLSTVIKYHHLFIVRSIWVHVYTLKLPSKDKMFQIDFMFLKTVKGLSLCGIILVKTAKRGKRQLCTCHVCCEEVVASFDVNVTFRVTWQVHRVKQWHRGHSSARWSKAAPGTLLSYGRTQRHEGGHRVTRRKKKHV